MVYRFQGVVSSLKSVSKSSWKMECRIFVNFRGAKLRNLKFVKLVACPGKHVSLVPAIDQAIAGRGLRMPSAIVPLLVDIKELKKVFGSKDSKLLREIVRTNEIDDEDTDPDDNEEDEQDEDDDDFGIDAIDALPSSKDALSHIIMGDPWARGIGSKYGYMFLEICQHLGERLEAANWGETRAEYVMEFDKVLKKLNVPEYVISMSGVVCGGGPFPLPPRSDAPTFGVMTSAKAAKAAKALAAVDRTALQKACQKVKISRGAIDAEFVVESFEELQSWCESCVAKKKDLIAFYF